MVLIFIFFSGCVYYNTFYYARKSFNNAESKRKAAGLKASATSYTSLYNRAIDKSQKVLDKYPNSSWYDDALYINGVSHYHTEDYSKAEKRFRELIANFPQSHFIKEARLYLAKSKLKMGEEADAMVLFEKLLAESKDRDSKAEAALALGQYYFENKDYVEAEKYFSSLADSLGDKNLKRAAQMYIADGYYARFKYKTALDNYLKILDMEPDLEEKYKVIFRAGECSLFLHDISGGMEYFNKLANDDLYYDSLSAIQLITAFGYELDGDLSMAENVYKQVATGNQRLAAAIANYNLGLIYQFDYEDYSKAKDYYDKAKSGGTGTSIYQDALQRSTDIGRLEEYSKRNISDSTITQEQIDSAAQTQYLLGELYMTQLGKPDSALQEFRYITEKLKDAYITPKAFIASALIMRDNFDDTLAFDTTLRMVLKDYPKSDFIPEAIGLLGLAGTKADSGYADFYYRKAEHFALEDNNIDSARYFFSLVADSFPRSTLNNQARFALLWLTETYVSPGDSSLFHAYSEFADSFATTEYGRAAAKKITVKAKVSRGKETPKDTSSTPVAQTEDTSGAIPPKTVTLEEKYFIGPDGETLEIVKGTPLKVDKEFKYPATAYTLNFEGFLYFQVKIDAWGDVSEVKLMNPTPSDDLNQAATEVVQVSHFDTRLMQPEQRETWFVYKYFIALPQILK